MNGPAAYGAAPMCAEQLQVLRAILYACAAAYDVGRPAGAIEMMDEFVDLSISTLG